MQNMIMFDNKNNLKRIRAYFDIKNHNISNVRLEDSDGVLLIPAENMEMMMDYIVQEYLKSVAELSQYYTNNQTRC